MPNTPVCNALSIVVSDMTKAIAFYRLCGLDLPTDAGDQPHAEARVTDGFTVMLDTADTMRMIDPAWAPPTGGHRMALAMRCETPADVDAAHQRMVDAGYRSHLAPFDAVWGQRYGTILDPDGTPVDFYAPLPTS